MYPHQWCLAAANFPVVLLLPQLCAPQRHKIVQPFVCTTKTQGMVFKGQMRAYVQVAAPRTAVRFIIQSNTAVATDPVGSSRLWFVGRAQKQ